MALNMHLYASMHGLFSWIFTFFLSPGGVLILSALDSSMIFFLPAAIDTVIMIMAARYRDWFWAFPVLATVGSMIGILITYTIGRKAGEAGLKRWVPEKRLERIRNKIEKEGAIAMGVMALIPPPFPFTPFVLTCGALGLSLKKFLPAVAAARFVRFLAVSILALAYGRRILRWLDSNVFDYVTTALIVIAFIGTPITIYHAVKRTTPRRA